MISVLLPTRKRLQQAREFINSGLRTALNPDNIEFILSVDDDDDSYDSLSDTHVKIFKGPRRNLSQCYLWEKGEGPIYMMGGDDVIFQTFPWDEMVLEEFDKYSDGIVLVYGHDGDPSHDNKHGTHPFIHRNWITATGRYLPPYFSGDFCDTWLNELADGVHRKVMIDIMTEHIHYAFGKRTQDETDKEKWDRHFRENMPKVFEDTKSEREEDIRKLAQFIKEQS